MSLPARPGVTIIVPVFNYAEFVGQALDSALNQSYPEVDVLVVDDGSTDETPHVLETYGDSIRVVTQDHRGLSAARNAGLREARHELVAFLDADDILQPSMVSVLHGTLTLMGESHALAAGANAYIDASGRELCKPPQGPAETTDVTRDQLLLRNHFAPSTVLARRDALLEVGGFDEDLPRAEDRDLWLRLAERYHLTQVPDILADVRLHFRNMSQDAELMGTCLERVLTAALARRRTAPAWEKRCWAAYHHECAWMFHDAHERWPAVWHELRSLRTCLSPGLRRDFGGPPWFRLRSLLRFLLGLHSRLETITND